MRRFLVIALLFAISASAPAVPLHEHLPKQGKKPAEYVLAKLAAHRIVILGESHWQRADAELVAALVPQLRAHGIALAMETLQSDTQADIDRLISAEAWDPALANRILLAARWPYVQYRDILQQAWKANRNEGAPMKILALSPPADWREKGIGYDAFMADAVASYATNDDHRVLVYCGMHHAFTRYQQIERLIDGRVDEFMDRMGNKLWRKAGEKVFLISLHHPHACGGWGKPYSRMCAPLGGAIDCGALRAGGKPVGFDVLGSPVALTEFDADSFYSIGHPHLRLIDFADGYIWHAPIDETRLVDLLPIEDYSPTPEDAATRGKYLERAEDLAHPERRPSWKELGAWRARCLPLRE